MDGWREQHHPSPADQPGRAYEVEFVDDEGDTLAMVTFTPDQVRPHLG